MEVRRLEEQLKALPHKPGVYLFRDASRNVLYVGKAANLHHRLRAYFAPVSSLPPKLQRMMPRVTDFEFLVTDSEQEALILECNLIKKHRPRFNVRLKDDKTYPYLKITIDDEWPRVYITRRVEKDGSRYFGPFASASSVRTTLELLNRLFLFRTCRKEITRADRRPCLEYDIHRCAGPCVGAISSEDYRDIVRQVVMFLEGKQETVLKGLERRMRLASAQLDFERAAVLRDQITAVQAVTERQKISSAARGDQDVIAIAQNRDHAYVEVFFIRKGKLIERDHFILQGTRDEAPGQIMRSFLNQFYDSAAYVPPSILLQHLPDDNAIVRSRLEQKRGGRVALVVPQRGEKKRLTDMVAENARQGLEQLLVKWLAEPDTLAAALDELQRGLDLPHVPRRVETYDVSDIQGTSAVGSMVVFQDGQPKPSDYRRFRIKAVEGADDYAMIQEVLRRRFKRATGKEGEAAKDVWAAMPDLVLIDGGRGHLSSARSVMNEMGVGSVPVAALAKEREELFRPGIARPIVLPRTSAALYVVQRMRDEAHRFALGYHQRVRRSKAVASALDNVPGIGPKRKRALLRTFGSVRAIKDAPVDQVAAVVGMTRSLAERVKEYL